MTMVLFPLPTWQHNGHSLKFQPLDFPAMGELQRGQNTEIGIMLENISHATKAKDGLTRIHLKHGEVIDVAMSMAGVIDAINGVPS